MRMKNCNSYSGESGTTVSVSDYSYESGHIPYAKRLSQNSSLNTKKEA